MNWQHLRTLLWVRWRLTMNHFGRHGMVNLAILLVIGGLALLASAIGFFVALVLGLQRLPTAPPEALMYLCDGWVLAFLFFWMIGVINDLQRADLLSLDKLLHLPTTLTEVFLFNFISSLVSLSTLTFVPPLLGISIATVFAKGPAALVMFPLTASFVLMVCAVTYQFRGWLATLMANKRRRQTVMMVIGISFMFLSQLPNLINLSVQSQFREHRNVSREKYQQQSQDLRNRLQARQISPNEYMKLEKKLEEEKQSAADAENQATLTWVNQTLSLTNLVLPIGWIAYGAKSAAAGNPWPGLLGTLGMVGITVLSLRRSYRSTVRYFTGEFTGQAPRLSGAPAAVKIPVKSPLKIGNMVEWNWPLVSEQVATIASATLRSLTRAPEVKMLLLGPFLMLILYGGVMLPNQKMQGIVGMNRSLLAVGILGLSIAGLGQLTHNCFGLDRAGFRAYVLCSATRRDILLGKNLALVPLVILLTVPLLILVQCVAPAPVTHFLATLLEIPTAYLVLSLLGNVSSILSPVGMAAGSLKPANAKGVTMLIQFLFGLATLVVLCIVAVLPVGVEFLLQFQSWLSPAMPVALILAALELLVGVVLYRIILNWQGTMLQRFEWKILESVTEKGE